MKTTIPTATWQKSSADYAEGMDNNNHPSYKKNSRFDGNQWSGHSNDGRLVNMGRGPTRGNLDTERGREEAGSEGRRPPTASVPNFEAKKKSSDSINGGAQVRTPGGTRSWSPAKGQNYHGNADAINVGRGPTKGNKQ